MSFVERGLRLMAGKRLLAWGKLGTD